jgi:hypothetical protein
LPYKEKAMAITKNVINRKLSDDHRSPFFTNWMMTFPSSSQAATASPLGRAAMAGKEPFAASELDRLLPCVITEMLVGVDQIKKTPSAPPATRTRHLPPIEDWQGAPDPKRRGKGGNVFVQPAPDPNPMAPAFLEAAAAIYIRTFEDQNGEMQEGAGGAAISNVRIRDGRRLNIPASYLYPVMDRPNLTVLTGCSGKPAGPRRRDCDRRRVRMAEGSPPFLLCRWRSHPVCGRLPDPEDSNAVRNRRSC